MTASSSFVFLRRLAALSGATFSLLFLACGPDRPAENAVHPVVRMAPFDLDCPRRELQYTQLDEDTWGVTGCGKRTKYVRVCRQVGVGLATHDDCQWLRN